MARLLLGHVRCRALATWPTGRRSQKRVGCSLSAPGRPAPMPLQPEEARDERRGAGGPRARAVRRRDLHRPRLQHHLPDHQEPAQHLPRHEREWRGAQRPGPGRARLGAGAVGHVLGANEDACVQAVAATAAWPALWRPLLPQPPLRLPPAPRAPACRARCWWRCCSPPPRRTTCSTTSCCWHRAW